MNQVAEAIADAFLSLTSLDPAFYDEAGSIGRRYRRQDEAGTPWCVTVDHDSLSDKAVTVRQRDTGAQERVPIGRLVSILRKRRAS